MNKKTAKPKSLNFPQALHPAKSQAKMVRPGRAFSHLRVWRATHLKVLDIASAKKQSIALAVAKIVEGEWLRINRRINGS